MLSKEAMPQDAIDSIKVLAQKDLNKFLDTAGASRESLMATAQAIREGKIIKHTYWNAECNMGCVKGTLYLFETGESVERHLDDMGIDEKDVHGRSWHRNQLMTNQFNGAAINPHSFFEAWFDQFFTEGAGELDELANWIDAYIAKRDAVPIQGKEG